MTNECLQLLLKDFEQWSQAYLRNEEAGERRLSFFLGVVAAVLTALGSLASTAQGVDLERIHHVGATAVGALLVLGALTMMRIVRRNAVTDGYLHALGTIRRRVVPSAVVDAYTGRLPGGRSAWTGGLAGVVAFVNAGLAGVSAWLATRSVGAALAAAVLVGFALVAGAIPWLERRARVARPPSTFRPGVGLLVRDARGRVLALERRDSPGAWQLPQGGIEEGEHAVEAARRELREETGLTDEDVAVVREAAGWVAYELPPALRTPKVGRGQVQRWVLFRTRGDWGDERLTAGTEARRLAWMSLEAVMEHAAEFRRPAYAAVLREFAADLPADGADGAERLA